jgi:hypothetical protein
MIRTFAVLAFAILLAGCSQIHSRAQGPFAKHRKEPPPPYGAVTPKPLANQSPLGISSADPNALPLPDEQLLIPKANGVAPAGGVDDASGEPNALPPLLKRRQSQPTMPKEQPKPTPGANAPRAPDAKAKNLAQAKELLTTAADAWKAIDTYEATLTRRELNPKGQVNSEVLIFQYRREPMSVYTRNIAGGGKGRETVYYPVKHGDKMYVMLGEGDSKLAKAGFIAPPISPDDSRVKEKARYSIRDSGFSRKINELNALVAKIEAGKASADSLVYQGGMKRDEYEHPLVGLTHVLRPGDDPLMPTGGSRHYFFDMKKESQSYGLPVLVIATDPKGNEAEYYLFEKFKSPANLTDADFHPDRFKKK